MSAVSPKAPSSLRRLRARLGALTPALLLLGSVAAQAAPPLPTTATPAPLEPVSACASLAGGPACLDPALPGAEARLASAVSAQAKASAARPGKVAWGGQRSGLPWKSGASGAGVAFEAWRGRRLDIKTGFLSVRYDWAELTKTSFVKNIVDGGYIPVLGVGLLPREARGQLAECAAGQFDAHILRIGRGLVAAGAGNAILRLGWEANRLGSFAWAVVGDGSTWKGCFRRWVSLLRSVPGQAFTIDFNMGARGNLPYSLDRIYPGAEYVDVIGTQRYDRCPSIRDDADWDALYGERDKETGNPIGLGAWLSYAKGKGKRFSVPEWGVSDHHPAQICPDNGFDNPYFIRRMFEFFRNNADVMAYESYFNGGGVKYPEGVHKIFPTYNNPNAARRYQELWSTGL